MDKKDIESRIALANQKNLLRGQPINKLQIKNVASFSTENRQKTMITRTGRNVRPSIVRRSDHIFISGSIGDVFAIESFMSDAERRSISTIFYASQKTVELESLFKALPNFPNLKHHISVWNDFSKFWCFHSLHDCVARMNAYGKTKPSNLLTANDFSIADRFPRIKAGRLAYNQSSFLAYKLADLVCELPERYFVVCPYSTDKRIACRDLEPSDWAAVLSYLEKTDTMGVILNAGNDQPPISNRLLDLSNKTTILEAIEILKKAKGYLGIDSSLSVLAAKLFEYPNLIVKSRNEHCYNNMSCYFAPREKFDFLVQNIAVPTALG
jgi:hypothetical protein